MINNTALEEEAALTFTEPDHGHELNLNISEENECGASVHAHKSKMVRIYFILLKQFINL